MTTTKYIKERLEDKTLSPGAREALERALAAQRIEVSPGWFIGDRWQYDGETGTVVSEEEAVKNGEEAPNPSYVTDFFYIKHDYDESYGYFTMPDDYVKNITNE